MHVLAALGDAPTAAIAVMAILVGVFVVARGQRGDRGERGDEEAAPPEGRVASPGAPQDAAPPDREPPEAALPLRGKIRLRRPRGR